MVIQRTVQTRLAMGLWALAALVLTGCGQTVAEVEDQAAPAPSAFLDQGWSPELRARFYYTPQGSPIMPYAWFMALEAPEGGARFADARRLARFGLIPPERAHPLNPGVLPIGFTVEPDPSAPGGRSVGMSCAACHTATVTANGAKIRLDGAPAHFDFDAFYADLARAAALTARDAGRFERFAKRALGAGDAPAARAKLKADFASFEARLAADAAFRKPDLASGFGRVDALTQIVNALAARDQNIPANRAPVRAPVSYPPLWLTPELEAVQWNPIASNPLGRNGGQVLGVFGTANLTGPKRDLFASTIRLRDVHALETWVRALRPPVWDETRMGRIDRARAAEGEALYRRNCAFCHTMKPYERTDAADNMWGRRFIKIARIDYRRAGTDPTYVNALITRRIRTNAATAPLFGGRAEVPGPEFFGRSVSAVIARAMADAKVSADDRLDMIGFRMRKGPNGAPIPYRAPSLTTLKAGPLAAAWATGPYLHNGSVPTIFELLSPVSERRSVFWTGAKALDLTRLGFESGEAPGRFRFDTRLPGNRNTGHEYPPQGLSPDQRWAIIEYLKTQ